MNFITWSFSKDVLLTPAYSTWSRVECVLCRSWAGSFNFALLRVSDLLPCCSNSDLTTTCSDVLFSAPNSKFGWSSDKGKDFIGLLVTSLEEDHSSAVPRLTLPNIGSSLLQNITCEDIESDGIHWKHYCKTKKKKKVIQFEKSSRITRSQEITMASAHVSSYGCVSLKRINY